MKAFSEGHRMINQTLLIKDEQELEHLTFKYRTFCMHMVNARIPRDTASPVYELDINLLLLDKILKGDDIAFMESSQENLFILGQLQDFLQQSFEEYDFEIDNVDLAPVSVPDYNITGASAVLTIRVDRESYTNEIDYEQN